MWAVSQRFIQTWQHSSRLQRSYVDVLHAGQIVATLSGDAGGLLNIGGKIQVGRNAIRRSGNIDFLDTSGAFTPNDVNDLFAFFGTEIRPYVGFQYWDATPAEIAAGTAVEYVPLATLVVTDSSITYPSLSLAGYDRMWLLSQFSASYHIVKGTAVDQALIGLIGQHVPGDRFQYGIPASEHATSDLLYNEQDDATAAAHDLANSGGWALYVDPMGVFSVMPEPSTDDAAVWDYSPGASSVMLRPQQTTAASGAYNTVVMVTSATDINPPLRSIAQDTNPDSISNVGRAGVRPYFEANPIMRTQTQLDQAAWTRLRGLLGIPGTLTIPIVPSYLHEPGDVVHVSDPDQQIDMNVIIDGFELGMRAGDGPQHLACRTQVST